ncbi:Tyrosine phosphatase family protein [Zostera marina]|uniref:diphosphoinositol-polyphosphate diphosphatase n=1 Tax=Zostera marina TaxID=29655 RepID=A0A0K9P223_ZOSMR|nr:Tyrosine phosphatase family protein [Zostera marina]
MEDPPVPPRTVEMEMVNDVASRSTSRCSLPPSNFGVVVADEIYRSACPTSDNFGFLQALNLKSILNLCEEEYPEEIKDCAKLQGIEIFHIGIKSNKDPLKSIPLEKVMQGLKLAIDKVNYPILIHCKSGKHRTGCMIASYRKIRNWDLSRVIDEYRFYSAPKERVADLLFIERFERKWFISYLMRLHRIPQQNTST